MSGLFTNRWDRVLALFRSYRLIMPDNRNSILSIDVKVWALMLKSSSTLVIPLSSSRVVTPDISPLDH